MLSWREIQKNTFTSVTELAAFLELSELQKEKLLAISQFPLRLPRRLAEKMQKGSLEDPLFLQFVPLSSENKAHPGYIADPLREEEFKRTNKLLIKYQSRALLLTTSACAMHCRFCFRRQFPYERTQLGFENELALISEDPSLEEIILSGGDPLSLSDANLEILFARFEQISHIKRIRFHTRFPIGIPERITDEFLSILQKSTKQIFFVLHANHPKELDEDVLGALKKIHRLGIPILNQTVLLKGVNDSVETLKALSQKLVNCGFFPYYLHALDEVEGTAHFEVSHEKAKALIGMLTSQLSGYAVPKFVKEIAGQTSKTLLT